MSDDSSTGLPEDRQSRINRQIGRSIEALEQKTDRLEMFLTAFGCLTLLAFVIFGLVLFTALIAQ